MYPILLKIDDFFIHTCGVLLALGFLLAVFVALREARRTGLDRDRIIDLPFHTLIAALGESRVFYVLTNWEDYQGHPVDIIRFWKGGLA